MISSKRLYCIASSTDESNQFIDRDSEDILSSRQFIAKCFSDGEVTVEHTISGEIRSIAKYDTPVQCCCFVSSQHESIVALVLCVGSTVFIHQDPFYGKCIRIDSMSFPNSVITCVSGCSNLSGKRDTVLFFGHYNGEITSLLFNIETRIYHKLLVQTTKMCSSFETRKPAVVKLKLIRQNATVDNDSLFSSQSYNSALSSLVLVVLYSSGHVLIHRISQESSLIYMHLLKTISCADYPLNLHVFNVNKHLARIDHGWDIGVIVSGRKLEMLLCNLDNNEPEMRIEAEVPCESVFTCATSVCSKSKSGCDILLFYGATNGEMFRARVTESDLLCKHSRSVLKLQSKTIQANPHQSFIVGLVFCPQSSKKIFFFDHFPLQLKE